MKSDLPAYWADIIPASLGLLTRFLGSERSLGFYPLYRSCIPTVCTIIKACFACSLYIAYVSRHDD